VSTRLPKAPLSELVSPVETWTPEREASDQTFNYVDLSSIDPHTKQIIDHKQLLGSDAPSRARQIIAAGDVLVSTVRPNLNGVARVPCSLNRGTASTGFCVLRPHPDKLDGAYLFHWVRSPQFVAQMVSRATGASYPAVSDRIVGESNVPLPPLAEQRRIAEILDKADALRAKRRAALAQLDTLTQAIFLDMFGEPALNPKGWLPAVLGDVVFSASDGPHVSPAYAEDGIPFLSTRHVRAGEITWDDLKFISAEDAEVHWRKCRPQRGDILYTKGGTTGLAAAVRTDRAFAVWVHVALLKPDPAKVEPFWLETILNGDFCYRQSQALTRGIANRDLGLTRMVRIKIYLPPLEEQRKFVELLRRLETLRVAQARSATELEGFFASLQHRAFRGEL